MTKEKYLKEIKDFLEKDVKNSSDEKGDAFKFKESRLDKIILKHGVYGNNFDVISSKIARGDYGIAKIPFSKDTYEDLEEIGDDIVVPYDLYLSFIPYSDDKVLFLSGNFRAYRIGEEIRKKLKEHFSKLLIKNKSEILSRAKNDEERFELLKKYNKVYRVPFDDAKAESEEMIKSILSINSIEVHRDITQDNVIQEANKIFRDFEIVPKHDPTYNMTINASMGDVASIIPMLQSWVSNGSGINSVKVHSNIGSENSPISDLTFEIKKSGLWIPIGFKLKFSIEKLNLKEFNKSLNKNTTFEDTFMDLLKKDYEEKKNN